MDITNASLRRVVIAVALLNLGYFGIEFTVALHISSVSLFADSIDFLEDASVNFLILIALAWTAARRAQVGALLAGILLVPALACAPPNGPLLIAHRRHRFAHGSISTTRPLPHRRYRRFSWRYLLALLCCSQ